MPLGPSRSEKRCASGAWPGWRSSTSPLRLRHNSSEMAYAIKVEYAEQRRMRGRNTRRYRLAHWPIWIWVFFLAPGPLTFALFAHGFGLGNLAWLLAVLVGTGG